MCYVRKLTFQFRAQNMRTYFIFIFISLVFNQVGKLRTSSHLQLRPGQYKAKQFDTYNDTELHMEKNEHTVNNTVETSLYTM